MKKPKILTFLNDTVVATRICICICLSLRTAKLFAVIRVVITFVCRYLYYYLFSDESRLHVYTSLFFSFVYLGVY